MLYELDPKNESCKKQSLPSHKHPLELPADATHVEELYLGSDDKTEQGLRVRLWSGNLSDDNTHHSDHTQGQYACLRDGSPSEGLFNNHVIIL